MTLTIRPFDGRLCHVTMAEGLTEQRQVLLVGLFSMTFWHLGRKAADGRPGPG